MENANAARQFPEMAYLFLLPIPFLYPKSTKSEKYLTLTEKISVLPQPHEGAESTDIVKCKNLSNIQYIKNKYSGQSMYAYI